MNDIDLVIPMVFPADPEWQREYANATGKPEATSNVRYRSWGTEELLIRCCKKYMPWLRLIHILLFSESQVQPWMERDPRLHIVFHRDFIPVDYRPCFSSPCIEMFLHLIPELSDRFIYANDDMFPLSPLSQEDFFTRDGRPCMHVWEEPAPRCPNIFERKCIFQQNVVGSYYDYHSIDRWLRTGHSMAPIMKSACQEVWRRHGAVIERNLSPLKRTDHSYNHYMFMLLPYFTGWYYHDHVPQRHLVEWKTPTGDLAAIIADPACGILCINDNDSITDWQERAAVVREAIEKKLGQQTI